jgi:flagellar biosynthetic protein FliR
MPTELLASYLALPRFGLVAARIAGLILFIPALSSLAIPMNVRVLLVIVLAGLLTPFVPLPADAPDTPLGLAVALGGELLVGVLMGLVAITVFTGLQLGAMLVAQEAGLAYAHILDPTSEEQETVLGVLYIQLGLVVYLILGGHRALLAACLDTFNDVPLLALGAGHALGVEMLVALQIAAPALLAMLLVNVALGFVSRTMPQLNLLATAFSFKSLIAFVVLAAGLPTAIDAFVRGLEQVCTWIAQGLSP